MIDTETIGLSTTVFRSPGELPELVVNSACILLVFKIQNNQKGRLTRNDRAGNKSDVCLALEQSDLNSTLNLLRRPDDIERFPCRQNLIPSRRGNRIEELLGTSRRSKGQHGGSEVRETHGERYFKKERLNECGVSKDTK